MEEPGIARMADGSRAEDVIEASLAEGEPGVVEAPAEALPAPAPPDAVEEPPLAEVEDPAGALSEDGGLAAAEAASEAAPPAEPPFASIQDDHYRALGVPREASREQVERSYRFCREMYGPGSLATYSLLEPSEVEAMRSRIDEAYEVLSNPARRRAYDSTLGILIGDDLFAPEKPAAAPVPGDQPKVFTGAALKRLREARGISLRQIALTSKIGLRFLEYIEEDRFSYLPPPVYLRGFLHEYARVVGLDGRLVAESYIARIGRR
jgi:hypothetical protein